MYLSGSEKRKTEGRGGKLQKINPSNKKTSQNFCHVPSRSSYASGHGHMTVTDTGMHQTMFDFWR
jgi:hypothetical protein